MLPVESKPISSKTDPRQIPLKRITKKTDLDKAVGSLKYAMSLIAIWPNLRQNFIQLTIWFGYVIGFFISISGSYAGALMVHKDFEQVVAGLGQAIPMTVITVKYALFRDRMKPLKSVLETMEKDWEIQDPNSDKKVASQSRRIKIMTTHARVPRIFFAIYITVVMICWMIFVIAPSARKISSTNETSATLNKFPMNSWYPFPSFRSPIFEIIYISEAVVGTCMVIAHTSIDSLLIAIIFHLCGQLEILRVHIEEFGAVKRSPEMMREDIKYVVQRHETLINIASTLEKSFNHILLGQLLGGTIHIGLAGFTFLEAMETNNPTVIVTFGLLLTMALQQIFIYSLAGDYLTSQGADIRMAVYKANWYELPPSVSKSFLLIMIRASKPITITAGKFFAMSLKNFTGILRSAVSYLSLLRAMNTD